MWHRSTFPGWRSILVASASLFAVPQVVAAQLIPVKTVPIAAGDQFMLFPSRNLGMAGVAIALDDPLLDPFVNPAKGSRTPETRLFVAPTLYDVSNDLAVGRSLPVGAQFRTRDWFGALLLSLQELEGPDPGFVPAFEPFPGSPLPQPRVLSESSHDNIYTFAMVGRELQEARISLGASVFWAGLDALEGVELLFPSASRVEQSGDVLDLRVGVAGQLPGERTWEALLVHNRIDMTYEFDRVLVRGGVPALVRAPELDQTNTWGLHLGYVAPLEAEGWRVGAILLQGPPEDPELRVDEHPARPGRYMGVRCGRGDIA